MIFVVEGRPDAEPQAWFAFDEADLLEKVSAGEDLHSWELWDCTTARELLDLVDESPEHPGVRERFPAMCELGDREGWDTPLYRADLLTGRGLYRREPIACLDACIAALRHRSDGQLRIYADEPSVLAAVDAPDPWFDAPGGWRARHALREQLIATEVLADGY
jgi:hypothetical protein